MKNLLLIVMLLGVLGCKEDILHVGNESEANSIVLSLRAADILADRRFHKKEWVVSVPSEKFTKALNVLQEKRVVRPAKSEISSGDSDSLFKSRSEKTFLANQLIAQRIERSLVLVPGILDARVHIYQEAQDRFALTGKKERTASILIIGEKGVDVGQEQIKTLVERGAGIPRDNIGIVITSNLLMEPVNDIRAELESSSVEVPNLGIPFISSNVLLIGVSICGLVILILFLRRGFKKRGRKRNRITPEVLREIR